jgi:hypothetical protein
MILIAVGLTAIIIGALAISYPEFVTALKEEDNSNWTAIGSPPPHAFHKAIGVYSWLQAKGYAASSSEVVRRLGAKAYTKAQFTKASLVIGLVLLVAGFGLALAGF